MNTDSITQYAHEVAEQLGETQDSPKQQIELMIQHLGRDFVTQVLAETEQIESDGGMKVDSGDRRRTKGGVFFYVAKGKMDADTRQLLFPNFGQPDKGHSVEWNERLEYVQPLLDGENPGWLRYATIKLNGRPGEDVQIEGNTVMLMLTLEHKRSPLPRGVPHFPDAAVTYTVYMGVAHWNAVKDTLDDNPRDRLVIEGNIYLDSETDSIAVAATNVTTQEMLKQARQAERAAANEKVRPPAAPASVETSPSQTTTPKPQKSPRLHRASKINGASKAATKPAANPDDYDIPDSVPDDVAEELAQLYSGAETLRERIAVMEQTNQSGVKMTKKLLRNTERKIEKLMKNYPA